MAETREDVLRRDSMPLSRLVELQEAELERLRANLQAVRKVQEWAAGDFREIVWRKDGTVAAVAYVDDGFLVRRRADTLCVANDIPALGRALAAQEGANG